MRFPVARYGLAGVSPAFLVRTIPLIIVGLDDFGFIVVTLTGDGAGENRAAMKELATTPASRFLVSMVGMAIDVWVDEDDMHRKGRVVAIPERGRVKVQYEDDK